LYRNHTVQYFAYPISSLIRCEKWLLSNMKALLQWP
jgi:hypothetical protein